MPVLRRKRVPRQWYAPSKLWCVRIAASGSGLIGYRVETQDVGFWDVLGVRLPSILVLGCS